jgi:hypothetical protein
MIETVVMILAWIGVGISVVVLALEIREAKKR